MNARRSPWWYRLRAVVIGAIYGASFVLGYGIADTYGSDAPAYATFGGFVGPHGGDVFRWLAALSVALCWAVRSWGSAYLRPETVWNADALTDRLIVDGPFRFVRNPLYLGNVLLALGVGSFAPLPGFVICVAGNVAFACALIAEESVAMRERYGATFDRFVAAVPALVPRPTPADVPGTVRADPSWRAGARSELFMAAGTCAVVVLATRVPHALPIALGFVVAGYVARQLTQRRPQPVNT